MADQSVIRLRDEREGKLAGSAQRIDDVLLGVTGMRRIQECRSRHRLNLVHIS